MTEIPGSSPGSKPSHGLEDVDVHVQDLHEQANFRGEPKLIQGNLEEMGKEVVVFPGESEFQRAEQPKPAKPRRSRPSAAGVRGPCGPMMPDYLNPHPRQNETSQKPSSTDDLHSLSDNPVQNQDKPQAGASEEPSKPTLRRWHRSIL